MAKQNGAKTELLTKLKKLKRVKIYWILIATGFVFVGLFYWYILRDLPSPTKLTSGSIPQSTQIYDRNGLLLYTIYNNKNQTFLSLSAIPLPVQRATIAIEDKDFYRHGPIDLRGIARAMVSIIFHKQIQGGSTITQQLVKNSLLADQRQTIQRKIKEAILAFATELLYPKDKILEMYLNQIPYGGTSYGIEAAAQTYFGKHANQLDLAESSLLAGLPESPTVYSPFGSHPELAKERQGLVLKDMLDQGYITQAQYQKATNETLEYKKLANEIKAPHFSLYIKDLLIKKYGEQKVEEGGLKVITSLDYSIEQMAQDTVATEMTGLAPYHVTNGDALVTNPATGEILAMVGSRDYYDTTNTDGNVNVTIQLRQPGSSIKPINYALGLLNGYTAATIFVDQATCFPNPGLAPYCPVNYDGKYHGIQTMRNALGNSLNIPAVKMLKVNGVANMMNLARQMGISTWDNPDRYGLSLTLGGGEVTMLDMATAYGVFANGGYRVDLHPILKITDHSGKVLEEYNPYPSPIFGAKVLPAGVAFIISDILADNGARLIDFGPSSELVIPKHTVSAKTGTTNDFRDNWTFGYTPSFLVAAWVGNNDNSPMSSIASGITGAAPIWHNIMENLLKDKPDEPLRPPSDVEQKYVCNNTGLLAPAPGTPNACQSHAEYFVKGTAPKTVETAEKTWIDKTTQDLPKPGQTDNLELKDAIFVTDPTGDKYCITCNHPQVTPTPVPAP